MARSSLSQTAAAQIISAQMSLAEKIARADHLVWNNGSLAVLRAQAEMLAGQWSRG